MKVVVIEPDTKSVPYKVIRATGYVSAVFSLVVCVLMIANTLSLKRLDPIHSPALTKLAEELKSNPRDPALCEEIRELDFMTRKAFFTSHHFTSTAILMLVGGLAVMVISFKTLRAYEASPPYPDSSDPKDDLVADSLWARKSVTAVGLVLAGFALVLALPWRSPLDEPAADASAADGMTAEPGGVAATPAPAAPVAAPTSGPKWPSVDELRMQWPVFLGAAEGRATGNGAPTSWDVESGEGLGWKSEVPLPGMNSPVVWKDRVFVSGADADNREVYCYDAGSGELRWKAVLQPAAEGTKRPKVMEDTGYAASTMATDGTRVFAIFADGDLAAFDFDGGPVWQQSLGLPENAYGYASSLAAFEDLVIVQFDREEDSFIAGIDAATGKGRWKTERDFGPSWASPRVFQTEQGPLLVTSAAPDVVAYDPRDGEELWRVECLRDAEVAVSPAYADGVVYASAAYASLTAIDAATQKILWQNKDSVPDICTPLVWNGLMLFGSSEGGFTCLDAKTGEEVWREDTDDGIFASPVLSGDNVYMIDRGGVVHVFKADGGGHQSVASPEIGEEIYGTPAISAGGFYVRGVKHLFRFGS